MTWTTRLRSDIAGQPAIVAGQGPSLLLLHGVGLRAEAWGAQIDALADVAHCVAPDMPGHGANSTATTGDLTVYIDAADAVLQALHGPVIVAGHSMGAMVAIALVARHPQKVAAVAALNAVFERGADAASAVRARAASLDGETPANPAMTLERWFGQDSSPERNACHDWLTTVAPAAYKAAYTAFATSTTPDRDMLAGLTCPTLFITGSAEPNSTPAMSQAMASIAPDGRAIIVDGAAHMLPMTHAPAVNTALRDLITATQQKGPI